MSTRGKIAAAATRAALTLSLIFSVAALGQGLANPNTICTCGKEWRRDEQATPTTAIEYA